MFMKDSRMPLLKGVSAKHPLIVATLRRQIMAGQYSPGAQLPPHTTFEKSFRASRVTIQKALDRLAEEGFVFTKGRRGTYVTQHLPHLCHYGLVFPGRPADRGYVRFWTALDNEGARLQDQQARRVFSFYALDTEGESPDLLRLRQAIESDCLAGLIFAFPPSADLSDKLFKNAPHFPRVVIASGAEPNPSPLVDLEVFAFLDRALDYMKSCRRRRIALITVPFHSQKYYAYFQTELAARNMATRPYWMLQAPPQAPVCAKNLTHLLFNEDQGARPDGLIVSDDNLVEYATSGLIAAGVKVPDDVSVVTHCNFPWPTPSVIPTHRLGFDARQVLQTCIENIDRQREGRKVPTKTVVRPLFEDELAD
jgi:DNA-binding LacI/PurR family transcriptional regulator